MGSPLSFVSVSYICSSNTEKGFFPLLSKEHNRRLTIRHLTALLYFLFVKWVVHSCCVHEAWAELCAWCYTEYSLALVPGFAGDTLALCPANQIWAKRFVGQYTRLYSILSSQLAHRDCCAATCCLTLIAFVNGFSVKLAARFQNFFTVAKLAAILMIIGNQQHICTL